MIVWKQARGNGSMASKRKWATRPPGHPYAEGARQGYPRRPVEIGEVCEQTSPSLKPACAFKALP